MHTANTRAAPQFTLCAYKDMFGEPGKGVHEARIFGIAFADTFLTFIGAIAAASYFNSEIRICNVICWFILLVLLGTIMHWIFCVDTALQQYLAWPFTEKIRGWH